MPRPETLYRAGEIMTATCKLTGVDWGEIISRSTLPNLCEARVLMAGALMHLTGMNESEIQRAMGSHSKRTQFASSARMRIQQFNQHEPMVQAEWLVAVARRIESDRALQPASTPPPAADG